MSCVTVEDILTKTAQLHKKEKCQDWVNVNVFENFPQHTRISHRYGMLRLDHLNTAHKKKNCRRKYP